MFKIFVALATIIVVARGQISQKEIDSEWNDYLKNQNLTKSTDEKINAEAKARFAKVHDRIQKHNKDPKSSYKMGHNFFSHMTDDQMSDFYGIGPALKVKETSYTNSGKKSLTGETIISSKAAEMRQDSLSKSVDHRNHKCMQPIKNQQHCGSCYAFGAVAVFEFAYCKVKNVAVSFSEQQIVDCFGAGCNGARPEEALDFIANNGPLSKSSDYSYKSGGFFRTFGNLIDGKAYTCKIKPKNPPNSPRFLDRIEMYGEFTKRVALMKRILFQEGVLLAELRITKNFNSYKSGVFSVEPCDSGKAHAVVIVGYNDDTTIPYWIVRNSWGTGWGLNGYAYIRSGANICGIEQFPSTFISKLDGNRLHKEDYPSLINPYLGEGL